MDENIASRLVGSAIEHVPVLFSEALLLHKLIETPTDMSHIPIEYPVVYQQLGPEHFGRFYPMVLVRNDLISSQAKRFDWSRLFHRKKKPLDYIVEIERNDLLVNMMQSSFIRSRSNRYSILGMYEKVYFLYNSFSHFERSVYTPQLVIPGHENDPVIKKWEDSLTKVHYNLLITRHPYDIMDSHKRP